MSKEAVTPKIREAALVGVINILVQPEYGQEWIVSDVLHDVPADEITEDLVEQVDNLIMEKLRALAADVVAELPAEKRKGWEHLSE